MKGNEVSQLCKMGIADSLLYSEQAALVWKKTMLKSELNIHVYSCKCISLFRICHASISIKWNQII